MGQRETPRHFYLRNYPMFQKEIVMGQPKWLIAKTKIQKKTLYGPSPNQLINRSNNYVPTIYAPLIDLGQNRWWPQLGILRNFAQPMKLHDASNGPLLGRVGDKGVKPLLLSMCSHQEHNGFTTSSSTCSQ